MYTKCRWSVLLLTASTTVGVSACADRVPTGPDGSPAAALALATADKDKDKNVPAKLVTYPSDDVRAIIGPQVREGTGNPWPWYDKVAFSKGLGHGKDYPKNNKQARKGELATRNYYDLGLTLYTAYYRSGDERYRALARKVADSWWTSGAVENGKELNWGRSPAPRNASLGGLMLRAMDGRPEMWPWITQYTRAMHNIWLGRHLDRQQLWFGVRDGGYALLHSAWLAEAHPNPRIRAEFRKLALRASIDYYARLQQPDGGWYWKGSNVPNVYTPDAPFSQPFQVGILLEGLIAVHQMTGNPEVARTIVRATDWLWEKAYRKDMRGMWYFVLEDGRGIGAKDMLKVREVRQLNPTVVHTFGYAYKLTGDRKYLKQGDEIFAATFGRGSGPGADKDSGLADGREKEYNQNFRSSGHYLAWRASAP